MAQKLNQKEKKDYDERIIRLVSEDVRGGMRIYAGLVKIKGISWGVANAICKKLNIDKNKKVAELTEDELKKISEFVKNPILPSFMINRKFDFETGEDKHVTGSNLELKTEFDIKRLKKIRSYRGSRHIAKLPVRGQKTKSNFRKNRSKSVGIKKKGKK